MGDEPNETTSETKPKPVQQPVSQPVQSAQKPKSNTVLIVVLITVICLVVLGAGGWFLWKVWAKKFVSQSETLPTQMKNLQDLLKYPDGTVTDTENSPEGTLSTMKMETGDKVTTCYNYYMGLAESKNWGLGRRGVATGSEGAFLRIEEKDFTLDFNFIKEEPTGMMAVKTTIEVTIATGSFEPSTDYDYGYSEPEMTVTSDTTKTGATPASGYMIEDSDTRLISESELSGFTPWHLKVARNEIYARYGRSFEHKDLQCYFSAQPWYKVDPNFSTSMLSNIENKNIAIILNYEHSINSPLLGKDSGC